MPSRTRKVTSAEGVLVTLKLQLSENMVVALKEYAGQDPVDREWLASYFQLRIDHHQEVLEDEGEKIVAKTKLEVKRAKAKEDRADLVKEEADFALRYAALKALELELETAGQVPLLTVYLREAGGQWTAQSLEFDYCAAGESHYDAAERFESGLCLIEEKLKRFGSLKSRFAVSEEFVALRAELESLPIAKETIVTPDLGFEWPFRGIKYKEVSGG